jgi:hypothetical protein
MFSLEIDVYVFVFLTSYLYEHIKKMIVKIVLTYVLMNCKSSEMKL